MCIRDRVCLDLAKTYADLSTDEQNQVKQIILRLQKIDDAIDSALTASSISSDSHSITFQALDKLYEAEARYRRKLRVIFTDEPFDSVTIRRIVDGF